MTSPTFVAQFADGVITRKTCYQSAPGDLDLARGMKLSRAAYETARDGQALCGCMTEAGRPCRGLVGPIQQNADEWKRRHRRETCVAHRGKSIQSDNAAWSAAIKNERSKAI